VDQFLRLSVGIDRRQWFFDNLQFTLKSDNALFSDCNVDPSNVPSFVTRNSILTNIGFHLPDPNQICFDSSDMEAKVPLVNAVLMVDDKKKRFWHGARDKMKLREIAADNRDKAILSMFKDFVPGAVNPAFIQPGHLNMVKLSEINL